MEQSRIQPRSRMGKNRLEAFSLYWVVALIWLVPDRRIERVIGE